MSAVYLLFEDESILHGSLRIDTPSYDRLAGQRSPTLPLERRYDFGVDGLSGRVVSCQAEKRAPPVSSLETGPNFTCYVGLLLAISDRRWDMDGAR